MALIEKDFIGLNNAGDSVLYARPGGNDSNSGASWALAKKTILSAYDALPSTGGVIHVADQTEIGGNTGQGLWLVGPNMPDYSPVRTGWRQAKPLKIVGHGGGASASFAQATIARILPTGGSWTGIPIEYTGASSGITLENILIVGGGGATSIARFGSHRPDGTPINDDTGGGVTAQILLKNCALATPNGGPVMMLGWTFFAWAHQLVLLANGAASINTDARAVYKAIPPTGGYAQMSFKECRISSGNFIQMGAGGLLFEDVLFENPIGDCGIYGKKPLVGNGGSKFVLRTVEFADLSLPKGVVDQDAGVYNVIQLDNVTVNGSPVGTLGTTHDITVRPCRPFGDRIANMDANSVYHSLGSRTPTRDAAIGIMGRLWGEHSGAARLHAPTTGLYQNLSNDLTGGTLVKGPDGLTLARRYQEATYSTHLLYSATVTPTVGDAFIFGLWCKGTTVLPGGSHRLVFSSANFDHSFGASGVSCGGPPELSKAVGFWDIHKFLVVVTSVAGGTKTFTVQLESLGNGTSDYVAYMPTVLYIPAGDMDPNELAEYYTHFTPLPRGAAVGDVAVRRGQRLGFYDEVLGAYRYIKISNGAIVIES